MRDLPPARLGCRAHGSPPDRNHRLAAGLAVVVAIVVIARGGDDGGDSGSARSTDLAEKPVPATGGEVPDRTRQRGHRRGRRQGGGGRRHRHRPVRRGRFRDRRGVRQLVGPRSPSSSSWGGVGHSRLGRGRRRHEGGRVGAGSRSRPTWPMARPASHRASARNATLAFVIDLESVKRCRPRPLLESRPRARSSVESARFTRERSLVRNQPRPSKETPAQPEVLDSSTRHCDGRQPSDLGRGCPLVPVRKRLGVATARLAFCGAMTVTRADIEAVLGPCDEAARVGSPSGMGELLAGQLQSGDVKACKVSLPATRRSASTGWEAVADHALDWAEQNAVR